MGEVEQRRPVPQTMDDWGPDCVRCGADEYRIDGYCSCECRDTDELEREIQDRDEQLRLADVLAEEAARVARTPDSWGRGVLVYGSLDEALVFEVFEFGHGFQRRTQIGFVTFWIRWGHGHIDVQSSFLRGT